MIKPFRPDPKTLQPLQSGPLAPHLNNFAALLTQQRYSGVTGWNKLRLISALSCWMTQKKVRVEKLNEHQIAKFLGLRWQRVAYHSGDKCTLALLLQHLRQLDVAKPLIMPSNRGEFFISLRDRLFLSHRTRHNPAVDSSSLWNRIHQRPATILRLTINTY